MSSFDKYAATAGVMCATPAAFVFGASIKYLPEGLAIAVGIACFGGFCWAVVKMEAILRGVAK